MDEIIREVIERWLTKAEHDLMSARNDIDAITPVTDTACFHTQQCAEKALKAYLVFKDEHIPKTHNLNHLINLCAKFDTEFFKLSDIANKLARYAITTRYPDDWRDIPLNEAEEAVRSAEQVMTFVKGKLGI